MEINDRFEAVDDDYIKFDRVENKKSQRPDLHAWILLDELFPDTKDMVCAASHDEIWLDIEEDQIRSLTDEQILELTRCGVRYDDENDSLAMFV